LDALELNKFLIDTVENVTTEDGSGIQMVTYQVLAEDASSAFERFTEEKAGVEVYRGDIVDFIIIGIQEGEM
jgi:hypothetical protein